MLLLGWKEGWFQLFLGKDLAGWTPKITFKELVSEMMREDLKSAERMLRRVAHPDVPDEVWEGFEQCEKLKAALRANVGSLNFIP